MRYFTSAMWQELQRPGERTDAYGGKWEQAFREYSEQLAALRDRLDDSAFVSFDQTDVHDGELLELRIIDRSRPAPFSSPAHVWETSMNRPVRVELAVLEARDEFVWRLSYSGIRHISVDFPGHPLFYQRGEGFGDWGYHELTDGGNGFLGHEVLFAGGSIVAIEFRSVTVLKMPFRSAA